MRPNSDCREPGLSYSPLTSPAFQPGREEGVSLDDLAMGAVVEVVTGHHTYRLENRGGGEVLISGHPVYCPEPVLMWLHGSVSDSRMIKMWFIGRGIETGAAAPDARAGADFPRAGSTRADGGSLKRLKESLLPAEGKR